MGTTTQQLKAEQRREQFSTLLRDMFQLNQPELDFGLYRIMHARKDDINRFIDQDLPSITRQAFEQFTSLDKTQVEQALAQARKAAVDAGFDPEQSPKVQELEAQVKDNFDLSREEGEVYDALVTFFRRYYSEGDFLSRRVYKDGTYAIPYQGEEVVLHWANKDQYYIKSSETLRDYSFRLNPDAGPDEDPMRVHFKLVDAEAGARDNNKEAADSKRVFILDANDPYTLITGEPSETGESYQELQLRFVFRGAIASDWTETEKGKATSSAQSKPPSQEALRSIAVARLLGASNDDGLLPAPWLEALKRKYRKADSELAEYSLLQGQLNNYTKKNTFDYFIHKNLGSFLRQELDFYIKNELLDWADIASLKHDPSRLAPVLSKIEVIRKLGENIITFLAQLEDFQKKLWLKKKFVTETSYCMTLDRIEDRPDLLKAVFGNERQKEDWANLYKLNLAQLEKDILAADTLSTLVTVPKYRYLTLDTSNFEPKFKTRLIASIEDLDNQCDGLLVNSENFQAINLLTARYREEVTCVYIDPPYNTDASSIMYKNGYKSSSWASLMKDRVDASKHLLKASGILVAAIDDEQQTELSYILRDSFNSDLLGVFSIRSNPSGRPTKTGYSVSHEYNLFAGKSSDSCIGRLPPSKAQIARFNQQDDMGAFEWRNLRREGSNSDRSARPALFYPIYIRDGKVRIPALEWDDAKKAWSTLDKPGENEKVVWPVNDDGREKTWRWEADTVSSAGDSVAVRPDRSGKDYIYLKRRPNDDGVVSVSSWFDAKYSSVEHGSALIKQLFGEMVFSYPKSLNTVEDTIHIAGAHSKKAVVLDYFAGSGTTAHAVVEKNRTDGGSRKYILVEMGDYFNAVLKPRIQKVVYSKHWKGGMPTPDSSGNYSGLSHFFKVIHLESYDDTLGNLKLNQPLVPQQTLLDSEESERDDTRRSYILNYLLNVETRGSQSLINTQQFLEPMHYRLNVRSSSGDETKPVNIDLLETFNYLLGLRIEHVAEPIHFDANFSQTEFGRWQAAVERNENGNWWFRTVYGANPSGQKVLVVWRNLPSVILEKENGLLLDNAVLDAVLIEKLRIRLTESPDDEIDLLYVNGDNNISIPKNRKGEPMKQARVQLIEEAFHVLMFADTESIN
ncbi:modification methylase, type III R/M system [gamma proteobacterium NOR5-3]|nr:modification methylase, type III R/M system [gamma proteobacterium NOR5-3]